MKIYYFPNGEIWNSILKQDEIITQIESLPYLEVDEDVPENKELIYSLSRMSTMRDASGLGKWYVSGGILYQRENWTPWRPL